MTVLVPAGAAALSRTARLAASARKIRPPFVLDETLRFYCPQENVEALDHPRVRAWLDFVTTTWEPTPIPGTRARLALLVPCTKYKPYPTSREHRGINAALLAAGWASTGTVPVPDGLAACLDPGESVARLDVSPLVRDGIVLDRFVVSEPLALVPYEHAYYWRGEQSPACSYDDPGLFESRGTSVCPHRSDSTATLTAVGSWRWGPAEREAYATMHAAMAKSLGTALARIASAYQAVVAWVSPGLTHRSFLADDALRRAEGLPTRRRGLHGTRELRGVLDDHPGLVEVLPTREQLADASVALRDRLAAEGRLTSVAAVRGVLARGDGHDTPLGLPEALGHLTRRLDALARAAA